MPEKVIAGEIEACANQSARAAQALQQAGFRVLHIGPTISVEGAQSLWESTFSLRFKLQRKQISAETGAEATYLRPLREPIPIPIKFQGLIQSVAIAEPPEWFDGPA
jgi:hypothetical protein